MIEARRSNILIINDEENEVKITDVALPGDMRVKEKSLNIREISAVK